MSPLTIEEQSRIQTEIFSMVEEAYGLSESEKKKLIERLFRFTFNVRLPRKDDRSCNKTPFFLRWDDGETSYLSVDLAIYATEEECVKIVDSLLAQMLEAYELEYDSNYDTDVLSNALGRNFMPNSLTCPHLNVQITKQDLKKALSYTTQRLGSFEIPTTYINDLSQMGRHTFDNVTWMKPLHINYKLRDYLKQKLLERGANSSSIKNALDKIQVKSYCTDKFTMPPHFSNRDVRWATWPESHQYASHYDCAMIEMELMVELFEFEESPDLGQELSSEVLAIRGIPVRRGTRKCLITGKLLNFEEYIEGSVNSQGGRSKYHVAHRTPLTRGGKHAWDNIEWASDAGNRIQGNETIEEIEEKLIQGVIFHINRDIELGIDNLEQKSQRLLEAINNVRNHLGLEPFRW